MFRVWVGYRGYLDILLGACLLVLTICCLSFFCWNASVYLLLLGWASFAAELSNILQTAH